MARLKLVIGNKNYSSWSLRGWLLLRHFGIPFEEVKLRLFVDGFKDKLARYSPAGRVPVLLDEGFAVWDTLAIAEYAAEQFPERRIWPVEARVRARARSVCAEMHSGFAALRNNMPMNITADLAGRGWNLEVQRDIDRICALWRETRAQFAPGKAYLFGEFSAADVFFAPVTTRFTTYGVDLPEDARAYVEAVRELPAMREWIEGARAENDFIAVDEPYRLAP